MRTLIVEDEPLAAERLIVLLQQLRPSVQVLAVLDSISETVSWLHGNQAPDLILLDIQLSDGNSFEIFRKIKTQAPIIFITALESHALEAFKLLSIDYLLKPVSKSALKQALDKLDWFNGKTIPATRS
ncbi:response regulator, partial [Flavihumibacter sp. CACIAM 22H1]|uniref:LytR/AlgR family response regulator transcription factor n=1 Tax=Flavihumibacter sp. CACIAM 22H1 TaxID=1812911 RepID=UPI0025C377C0